MTLKIAILAAGSGTRMHSDLPKVLHRLAGNSLLAHVISTAQELHPEKIYVVYHHDEVKNTLNDLPVEWVRQDEVLGTGHAVQQVLPFLNDDDRLLVLCGDVPLIPSTLLQTFIETIAFDAVGCLSTELINPTGFGRIIRAASGHLKAIVEERDATDSQRAIQEINTGVFIFPAKQLQSWLSQLKNDNAQKEYYLTDVSAIAVKEKVTVALMKTDQSMLVRGINTQNQLADLERFWQCQNAQHCMEKGLCLADFNRFDVRGTLAFGRDVEIDVNVVLEGNVTIGSRCKIGPNVFMKNVVVGDDVEIKANSYLEDAVIGNDCKIGPFARLRPGAELHEAVHIGNFVEVKKSVVGAKTKISHLTYIGDSTIGKNVNVGAGVITCNYDGVNKHPTIIGDNVFVGSDTQFIAPVTIGDDATIGAGSTITQNVPAGKLTLSRVRQQTTVDNWQRPVKEK